MRKPRLGFGLAGLGTIGRIHAANLAGRVPGGEVVRVVDSVEDTARRLGEQLDVPWSSSFQSLLEDRGVQAIIIATPPYAHPEMVELAAEAGKHIFCEKPLALTVPSAERALEAVERSGVLLQVGFHRRFDRDFVAAKRRIDRGELGQIYTCFDSMRDSTPPPIELLQSQELALLHDTACHDFDSVRWLVGEVTEVTTFGAALSSQAIADIGEVDHVVTLVRFENGALGVIENSLASGYGFDCRCEIVGSQATVRIDSPHVTNVRSLSRGTESRDHTSTFVDRFADAYPREIEAFIDAVAAEGDIMVSGEDGLAAVVLVSAAERSLVEGHTVEVAARRIDGRLRYEILEVSGSPGARS